MILALWMAGVFGTFVIGDFVVNTWIGPWIDRKVAEDILDDVRRNH